LESKKINSVFLHAKEKGICKLVSAFEIFKRNNEKFDEKFVQ